MPDIEAVIQGAPIRIEVTGAQGPAGPAGPSGASAWDDLTGTLSVLPFNTANGAPANLGEVTWDQAEETLSLMLKNGTVLQVGQETLFHVENNTVSQIADGTPVQYAGTVGASGKIRVVPWDGLAPKNFIGIATGDIDPNGETGYVARFGKVRGIQTNGANYGETWASGDLIYAKLGAAGLTKVEPTAPGLYWMVGMVISAHATNGTLFVNSQLGKNLVSADISDASTGGNGAADAGKLTKFGATGSLSATSASGNAIAGTASDVSSIGVLGVANAATSYGMYGASGSGTGGLSTSGAGTYHHFFGTSGDNRSFVARVLGSFGWFRGAFTGILHAAATLTANRTWTLPDKTGTVALTSDIANRSIEIQLAASDETTALTVGDGKVVFRAPCAFLLTAVRASVTTAPTGSTLQVQIRNAGNDVLSTKLSIDASEKTSTTAATPAVINTTYDDFADDAEIHIDLDQVGSTIAGAGLKITLIGTRA